MRKALLPIMLISWSAYFVLCEFLIAQLNSPYFVGFLLRSGTLVILLIYNLITKSFQNPFKGVKCGALLLVTALLSFSFDCLINIGLQFTSASSGTALLRLEIIFVFLINSLVKKEKLGWLEYFFSGIMMVGAITIILGDILTFSVDWWSLFFIASAFMNAICAFLIKKIHDTYNIKSHNIAVVNNFVALLMYSLCTLVTYNFNFDVKNSLWNNILPLLGCTICQATLLLTYYKGLAIFKVWLIKVILLFIPVLTTVIQFFFFKMEFQIAQIIGIGITILSGMALIIIECKKSEKDIKLS